MPPEPPSENKTLPPPAPSPEVVEVQETRLLHQEDFGHTERLVRAILGLPIAVSFIYVRHFSVTKASLLLVSGLYLLFTAVFHYCAFRHLIYWLRFKHTPR